MRNFHILILFLSIVELFTYLQANAPQYEAKLLFEDANRDTASVFGINNRNEIVGKLENSAFVYSNGFIIDLEGVLGYSSAQDINDNGQIVGYIIIPSTTSYGFLYSLKSGEVDYFNGTAYAINNAGQIAGSAESNGSIVPAVFLSNGTISVIGSGLISGKAYSINDKYGSHGIGQVVGTAFSTLYTHTYPFFYADGEFVDIDPSCKSGSFSVGGYANSINNLGQATAFCGTMEMGYCGCAMDQGYIYNSTDNTLNYFGTYTVANDINDSGWAVGYASQKNGYPALIINGVEYNLYDLLVSNPGLSDLSPVAINNAGNIAADSDQGPVLLTLQ